MKGRLFGVALPSDTTAVRVVRVGGGSAIRRLGRSLGRGNDHTRELSSVPALLNLRHDQEAEAEEGVLAAWDGPVVAVSKTIHAAGANEVRRQHFLRFRV